MKSTDVYLNNTIKTL